MSPRRGDPTRRAFLGASAAVGAGLLGVGSVASAGATRDRGRAVGASGPAPLDIRPRESWGSDLAAGPLDVEAPGDVRFLLVHHTAGANRYEPDDVPTLLRQIHAFHTGAEKGWPDVAYNFFVDRYGAVWEGRTGSLEAPVKGDATGGSQGFALLCCFVGDHSTEAPTPEAQVAMVSLLAWLADTYDVDTTPGSTATFVSRGSDRHPVGSTVTTPTVAGHRDMSTTACPGDAAYALVTGAFPAAVTERRTATATTGSTPPSTVEAAAPPPSEPATAPPTSEVPPSLSTAPPSEVAAEPADDERGSRPWSVVAALGVAAAATAGGLVAWRNRRAADRSDGSASALDSVDAPVLAADDHPVADDDR